MFADKVIVWVFSKVRVLTQAISCSASVFLEVARRGRARSREQSQERSWDELSPATVKTQEGEMV